MFIKLNGYLRKFRLLPLMKEHRPPTRILRPVVSLAILSSSLQFLLILRMSNHDSRRSVFFGFPIFFLHPTFQVITFLVIQFGDSLIVCSTHFHRRLLISSSDGTHFVLSNSRLLFTVTDQRILNILGRQLFIDTCTFSMMDVVVPQASAPCNKTDRLDVCTEDSHFDISWHLFSIPYVDRL